MAGLVAAKLANRKHRFQLKIETADQRIQNSDARQGEASRPDLR
jgi:hypothetical protein